MIKKCFSQSLNNDGRVAFDEKQCLTPSQKEQARKNIGALGKDEVPEGGVEEAPKDGIQYGRKDGEWTPVVGKVYEGVAEIQVDNNNNTISLDKSNIASKDDINVIQNDLNLEISNRTEAEENLQSQIDGLSQVTDSKYVVQNYSDLLELSPLENEIGKVLTDETKLNSTTFYRFENSSWIYIGTLGSYYTKPEIDKKLSNERTITNKTKLDKLQTIQKGFFVTDENDNIALQYDENGFDVAEISDHFKQVFGMPNFDFSEYGYSNIQDAVTHLLSMEKVLTPSYDFSGLTDLEITLMNEAKLAIDAIDPENKMMKIGFISDTHHSIDNIPYGPVGYVTTAEPSIKLLGAIAANSNLDCVVHGGDFSTGADLSYEQYTRALEVVRGLFLKYVFVPTLITEGNHDHQYNSEKPLRTSKVWKDFMIRMNWFTNKCQVSYLPENSGDNVALTYFADFPEKKIRLANINSYQENDNDVGYKFRLFYDTFQMPQDKLTDYLYCDFTHNEFAGDARFEDAFLKGKTLSKGSGTGQQVFNFNNGNAGYGFVARLRGHAHQSMRQQISSGGTTINVITVANAFCELDKERDRDDYCFSVFVIDRDNWKLHEIQVGRFGQHYEYDMNQGGI